MPSRVIRGEINRSESLSTVSMEAELAFRALLMVADEYGRFDARPAVLKAELFPLRESATPAKIILWIGELARLSDPPIRLYESDGRAYGHFPKWELHRANQRRGSKSRLPDPPEIASVVPETPGNSLQLTETPLSGSGSSNGSGSGGGGCGGDRADAKSPATPAPAATQSSRKPKKPRKHVAYQSNGWDLLPPERIDALRQLRPGGVLYSDKQVAAWFAATAPRMREYGKTDLSKAAGNWFPRAKPEEIAAAERWCMGENARREPPPPPPREITPELRAQALQNVRRLGGT